VLAGDSAGGNIVLAAVQQLGDTDGPMPAGLLLIAPLVDIELAHPDTVAAIDAAGITRDAKFWWAFKLYANGLPFSDPSLSPINASVAGWPPVHLNVGTEDFFLRDVRRLRNALRDNAVPVTYLEQEGSENTSTPFGRVRLKPNGHSPNRFDGCAASYLRRDDPGAGGRPSPRPNPDRCQRGCRLSAPRRGSVIASRPSILTFMSNRTSSGHLA
jgi:acetyl esterase/lipase